MTLRKRTTYDVSFSAQFPRGSEGYTLSIEVNGSVINVLERNQSTGVVRKWSLSKQASQEIGDAFWGAALAAGVPTPKCIVDPFEPHPQLLLEAHAG